MLPLIKRWSSPWEVIRQIRDAIAPADYSVIKSEDRLKAALAEVLSLQPKLEMLKAKDYHELTDA